MKQYFTSQVTGIEYCPEDTIPILNIRQVLYYMQNGIRILDVYPSTDYKTQKGILLFVVDRKETAEIYKKWRDHYVEDEPVLASPKPNDLIRVLNIQQVIFYMKAGVQLVTFEPSIDYKTQESILAFYFDRNESKAAYAKWKEIKANS